MGSFLTGATPTGSTGATPTGSTGAIPTPMNKATQDDPQGTGDNGTISAFSSMILSTVAAAFAMMLI